MKKSTIVKSLIPIYLLMAAMVVLGVNGAAAQPFVYVVNSLSQTVSVIDTVSNTVIESIPISVAFPARLAFSPDGGKGYLTSGVGPLVVLDPILNTEITTIPTLDSSFLDFSPDGQILYVTTGDSPRPGSTFLVDTSTELVALTIPLLNGSQDDIVITPDGLKAYVSNSKENSLWILDLVSNTPSGTITVGERPIGLTITAAGNFAYSANQALSTGQGTVSIIDVAADSEIEKIDVGGLPFDLELRPDDLEIYVTNHATNDTIDIIETASKMVVASVTVGTQPFHIAFTPDSSFAYVTNTMSDTVSVINTTTRAVVATIPVGRAPVGIAFLPPAQVLVNVLLDIKPGSDPNSINPKSKGKIPVAILTTDDFDAWDVDSSTLVFGPGGATIAHSQGHAEDVDGDGDLDRVVHFNTQETGIVCGETDATLTGETLDGQAITGTDSIKTVGCK